MSYACPAFFATDYAVVTHQRLLVALCEAGSDVEARGEDVKAAIEEAC